MHDFPPGSLALLLFFCLFKDSSNSREANFLWTSASPAAAACLRAVDEAVNIKVDENSYDRVGRFWKKKIAIFLFCAQDIHPL
jgi:hypothetical protein